MDSYDQKKYDNFAEFDTNDFEFLYTSSSKLIDIDSKNELFKFLSKSLFDYGGFVVLANEYDPINKDMTLLSSSGLDKYIDIVIDVLGRRLKGFKIKVDDKRVDIVLKNKFIEIEGGVYNLVEKSIPKNVCLFLEKLFGVKYVYLIGLIDKNSLLGNVVLLSKEPIKNNQINVINYFLNTASMALQKVKKDEELLNSNKMLEIRVDERTAELNKLLDKFKEENEQHKLTQNELENAKNDLAKLLIKEKELNELKTRFISTVSHEYRTPLTLIQTSTYILEKYFETRDEKNFKDQLEKVKSSIKYMTELLQDIITFGKSSSEKINIFIQSFDIVSFIKEIVDDHKLINKKNHNIIINSNEEALLIKSDLKFINHIVSNLVQNAIKYSPEKSKISIDILSNFDVVQVSVADKGIGISESELEHLFDPFFRGENVENIAGTGLGLSIAHRYAEELGGSISVVSQLNEGTTFTVSLPRKSNSN